MAQEKQLGWFWSTLMIGSGIYSLLMLQYAENKGRTSNNTTTVNTTTSVQTSNDGTRIETVKTCTCVTFQEAAARKQQDQPKIIASNSLAPKP